MNSFMLENIEIQPNIMGFVTTDKIGIPNLEVRIEWHRGQFENSYKDSRDPSSSRFRHILLYRYMTTKTLAKIK